MELDPVQEPTRLLGGECLLQARPVVRVQVVLHQADPRRPRVVPIHQVADTTGVEQQSLYNAINWSLGAAQDVNGGAYANSTVILTKLSVFLCPSCPPVTWNYMGAAAPLNAFTATGCNYFGSVGSCLEYDGTQTGGPPNGPFQYGGPVIGLNAITDGSSNTVAFGESKGRMSRFQSGSMDTPGSGFRRDCP
jgi:hypothetical protein